MTGATIGAEVGRWSGENMRLCDGTPRKENGFRVWVEYSVHGSKRLRSAVFKSPLLDRLEAWEPSAEVVSAFIDGET